MAIRNTIIWCFCFTGLLGAPAACAEQVSLRNSNVTASSNAPGFTPAGATDGERFSAEGTHAWQGASGQGSWWWQVRFDSPREVGAILQITGDHSFVLRNAPVEYAWQWSPDGEHWNDLPSAAASRERRMFRIHRLINPQRMAGLRFWIAASSGSAPTLREVEFYSSPSDTVDFPDWIVAVNTTDQPALPGHGQEFIPLARSCPGWGNLQAQQVWLADFDESFASVEPRPLCAFLSGNFKDWCQIDRGPWRGTQDILRKRHLPLWASCGGAQGLAILAETGADRPWDCPHCRDPLAPKTPIYTHIGHTGIRPCGDYSACIFERGPHSVRRLTEDPVFEGLPNVFKVMESHCGQIEWAPKGWQLIATAGPGARTQNQCLRVDGTYIYAAQFHIEMEGTPETSRRIMSNFLGLARKWGGWNPRGKID